MEARADPKPEKKQRIHALLRRSNYGKSQHMVIDLTPTNSLGDVKSAPVALPHTHCAPVYVTVVFQQRVGEPRIFGVKVNIIMIIININWCFEPKRAT